MAIPAPLSLTALTQLIGTEARWIGKPPAPPADAQFYGVCSLTQPCAQHIAFVERIERLAGERDECVTAWRKLSQRVGALLLAAPVYAQLQNWQILTECSTAADGVYVFTAPAIKIKWLSLLKHFDPYANAARELLAFSTTKSTSQAPVCGSNVHIGPNVLHGKDVHIGNDVTLMGANVLGSGVCLGAGVILHPGVNLYPGTVIAEHVIVHAGTVIGSDGFGYEATAAGLLKIPQIGTVRIGAYAEIGANVTIDRGTLDATIIGAHVKIDNLVQLAHNVIIGDGSIIVAQSGIAGSSRLGRGVLIAGQVGIADHTVLGDGVRVGAQSGVLPRTRVAAGSALMGSPALTRSAFFRREHFLLQAVNAGRKGAAK